LTVGDLYSYFVLKIQHFVYIYLKHFGTTKTARVSNERSGCKKQLGFYLKSIGDFIPKITLITRKSLKIYLPFDKTL